MASAGGYYFIGADAKLWVQESSVSTAPVDADIVAVVKGWNFSIKFDMKTLDAMDSIMILAINRCKCKVEGSFKFVRFDPATGWFKKAIDTTDTSKVNTFTITGKVKPSTGSDSGAIDIDSKIEGCRFSSVSFSVDKHEWVSLDLPFLGSFATIGGIAIT